MSDAKAERSYSQVSPILSRIVAAYAHDRTVLPALDFGAVTSLSRTESGSSRAAAGSFTVRDDGEAMLRINGRLDEGDAATGEYVRVELADGSLVQCNDAFVTSQGTSISRTEGIRHQTELQLREWRWEKPEKPVAWVGVLRGARTEASNLHIKTRARRSYDSLRLDGNATWYLTNKGALGKNTCLVVVDTKGIEVQRASLWQDFAALEFLFGTPLRLDLLIGIDEENQPVAAHGASFGYRYRPDSSREPPLPDDRDHAWIAVAFPLLVKALAHATPNPTTIATCGYVDSTIGHIDGQYLFAQVALEAAAYRLTDSPKPVVNDVEAWKAWARSQRPALDSLAADPAAVNVLAVKLRDAYRPTTSRLVLRKFQEMSIEPPQEALDEIEGRNVVAHTLSMTDGEPYEIERDIRRIRMVRSMLAGMILRHVGYSGALSGWDLDKERARQPAEWFPATSDATNEAQHVWEAVETAEGDAGA